MNTLELLIPETLVLRLGWTLLHFLWQGAVAAALLALLLPMLRSASGRYVAAGLALLAMAAAPAITFCLIMPAPVSRTMSPPAAVVQSSSEIVAADSARRPGAADSPATGVAARPVVRDRGQSVASPSTLAHRPLSVRLSSLADRLRPHIAWIVGFWLAGVALLSLRLLAGWWRIRQWTRRSADAVAGDWAGRCSALARRLRVSRPVRLLESTLAEVPLAMGWLRPVILLPTSALTGLTPAQIEAILAHELAHIRRCDYLVNLLQSVVETLLFYHPAIWWVSHRMRVEREFCCDDLAAQVCGNPAVYARALAAMETLRGASSLPRQAMAATGGSLLERVARLLGRPVARRTYRASWLAGVLVLVLLATLGMLMPRPGSAQTTGTATAQSARYRPITPETQPTSDIPGTVVDEQGKPVANVTVQAVGGPENAPELRTAQTDAAGHFDFPNLVPSGYWFFSVDDPNYGWMWNHECGQEVPAKPEDLPVAITLYAPRPLDGIVVDPHGNPVSGVRVVLVNEWLPGAARPISGHIDVDFLTALTDGAGRFRMERLRPGKISLVLSHPDYATTLPEPFEIGAEPVRFTIETGLWLHGHVTTPEGQPLEGVALRVGMGEGGRSVVSWRGTTDSNGDFTATRIRSMPPESRAYAPSVGAHLDDSRWVADSFSVYQIDDNQLPFLTIEAKPNVPGQKPAVGNVDVGKKTAPQATTNGAPAPSAAVQVSVGPSAGSGMVFFSSADKVKNPISTTQAIRQGPAKFAGLPPGRYVVSYNAGIGETARPPRTVEVAEGQTLDVTLEPGPSRIVGVVRSGSQPVGNGYVSWYPVPRARHGVFQGSVELHADGRFSLEGLPEGRYRLIYEDMPRSMPYTLDVDLKGASVTQDIELPTSRIEGTLVGIAPKPVSPRDKELGIEQGDIRVQSRTVLPKMGNDCAFVYAGADGRFTVAHLTPGIYTITGYDCQATVTIKKSDSVVQAELKPAEKTGEISGTIRGTILPAENSMGDVSVTAFAKDSLGYDVGVGHYSTMNEKSRKYSIRNLPVGTYAVWLTGTLSTRVPYLWIPGVEVREGQACEVDIDIPENRIIQFVRADPDGAPATLPELQHSRLRIPSGDWLDGYIIAGRPLSGQKVALSLGSYTLEADYGSAGMLTQNFTVAKGEGVQEIAISLPTATR